MPVAMAEFMSLWRNAWDPWRITSHHHGEIHLKQSIACSLRHTTNVFNHISFGSLLPNLSRSVHSRLVMRTGVTAKTSLVTMGSDVSLKKVGCPPRHWPIYQHILRILTHWYLTEMLVAAFVSWTFLGRADKEKHY
jgi:hypothetical protein